MRFVRKGGIWKNTEDEILKVAVMKYGKNQWARISSLLVRKSAKQCKARWYEWLDPSVKKTEWTREEEEKLLHLAKIMPSQWRSIATLVGRTSTQCLEHYGKLLDQAQALDQGADNEDDLIKRLRPGDIDINPESKPARPDPIDMDEDEKEMLSEARARLANTKGKKAKRKAREKQLEEARRLATLQKRRELKAAGIEFKGPPRPSKNKNKRKEMDYNSEIPLERRVPKGFYDTSDEDHAMKRMRSAESFIGKSLAELDGKRRDEIEAAERKKDAKRQDLLKKHDLPSYIAQITKLNDPHLQRQRPTLNLPAPQITDKELHDLAAMGILNGDKTPGLARGPAATPTPMRTPAMGAGVDSLVMEAQNLLALERSQTPLHGGENAFLHPSDFSSATPKTRVVQTPNSLALIGGLTPRSAQQQQSSQATLTPVRDAFRINMAGDEYESTPAAIKPDRQQLRAQFGALPTPHNEFSLALTEVPAEDDDGDDSVMIPDADDVRRWEREQQTKEERIAFLLQSTALQRPELPRPTRLSATLPERFGSAADPIEALIHADMIARMQYDLAAVRAPVTVSLDELVAARRLVDGELGAAAERNVVVVESRPRLYIPSRRTSVEIGSASKADLCEGYRARFQALSSWVENKAAAVRKQEGAVQSRIGPLMARTKALREQLLRTFRSYQHAVLDLDCFRQLQVAESCAIPDRIRRMQDEVARVVQHQEKLQQQYRLLNEKCKSSISVSAS